MTATPLNGFRPRHLSHSSVDRFERCPRAWYDSYALSQRFPATRPMLIGSLFGKGIEWLHLGEPEPDIAYHHGQLREDERTVLEDDDIALVERMVDMYRTSPGCPYPGIPEYRFTIYLPDREAVPYPILGFMDVRENDAPIIHEMKTGKWSTHPSWGWDQHRVNTSPQSAIYWYADKMLSGRDSVVKYTIVGYANDRISMIELETHPTMLRVLEFQEKAAKLCRAIEAEEFPDTCGRCVVS